MTTRGGTVRLGDESCSDPEHEDAVVDGSIRSRGEMRIRRPDVGREIE